MQTDMTKGSAFKLLLFFTIPIFLGNMFQQLYLISDTLIVSRLLGIEALAAVGATSGFNFMVTGAAQGLTMGFGAIISQHFGAKDYDSMRHAFAMSILLSILVTVFISLAMVILCIPSLRLIGVPENIFQMSNDYISIIYMFLIFTVMYNLYACVLRAMGDSRSPLYFMLISSGLNIVLDIVSILVFHMGVKGAALATVFSQGVSAFLCFIYINKKFNILKLTRKDFVFNKRTCNNLLKVGLPSAIQYSITAISVIIVQSALNTFGSDSIAAYSLGIKIENIVSLFYPALGMAIATYAGQNLGAKDFKRIKKGFKDALFIDLLYSILAAGILFVIAKPFTLLFVDAKTTAPIVIEQAVFYVTAVSYFFFPLGSIFIFRTGCTGLGSGRIPLLSAFLELFARVTTAFTLPKLFGFAGIAYTDIFSWILAGGILPIVYVFYIRKLENNYEMASKTLENNIALS